ncbi:polar amino acid transport system substrate-binding protein [Pseudorhizobium tarimense]|uniref:Polar amino acid transport system substrate-binding protein n=2 Tax=Pseudorhizobium tarimense TaxID=1079109 RepID=A0ABV2HBK6_9HYPH
MMVSDALRAAFAPYKRLRVALNHGNRVLVSRDKTGDAYGITVDLARALAQRLELELEFIHYERAIDVSNNAAYDRFDICFLAVDPKRAETIAFTDPYIRIEGSYLAAPHCDVPDADTLVADGLPVGSVEGSAYTLDLSRKPGSKHLVVFADVHAALEALDKGAVAAIAGIRDVMQLEAEKRPGARVLDPPFMEILQAMGMPVGRPDAAQYLRDFVSDMARSGRVGEILERHGISAACAVVPSGEN